MNTRKYSIIVVTLNNANGLSRTLQSIRSLNYGNIESVIIDGGSHDSTPEIVSANKDIVTTYISEKDSGIYNAMNKGLRHVTGDYVVFMNAGDAFAHKDVLATVNHFDGDIILGGETYGGEKRMMRSNMSLYDILSIGINHQAVYYRREIIQKYGFDESYQVIADLKSVVEPLAKDKITISCTTEILATCEGGGISKQRWKEALLERRRIIEEVIEPLYKDDYLKFSRLNNEVLNDFIVLSHFHKTFPIIRALSAIVQFLNAKFKHIPIEQA